jgi:glycosyltransferase involved in cell wall biosynthesis
VLLLSTGLAGRGWTVEVAMSPTSALREPLAEAGIETHLLPLTRDPGLGDLRAARALRGLDEHHGYAIVHAHSSKAGALVRGALRGRSRLIYTPNCFPFSTGLGRGRRMVYRAIEQALVPRSAAIVAVSDWERNEALTKLRGTGGRLRMIHNGVSECGKASPHPALVDLRGDGKLVGMVAALRAQKDPLTAVRAFARVVEEDPAARLAVVGNGELAGAVEGEIERLRLAGVARRFPFEPPAERYLRALDVFVLPALWEALPHAPIEAMACRVPVVATPVGGAPEIVDHGVTGLLVPPSQPDRLAEAISDLLASDQRRAGMASRGRQVASERFSVDRVVDSTEALYEELLARQSGQRRSVAGRC